jgi:hypothetical protein
MKRDNTRRVVDNNTLKVKLGEWSKKKGFWRKEYYQRKKNFYSRKMKLLSRFRIGTNIFFVSSFNHLYPSFSLSLAFPNKSYFSFSSLPFFPSSFFILSSLFFFLLSSSLFCFCSFVSSSFFFLLFYLLFLMKRFLFIYFYLFFFCYIFNLYWTAMFNNGSQHCFLFWSLFLFPNTTSNYL